MNEITVKPNEVQEVMRLCLTQGIINDIDLSNDIKKEFKKQYAPECSQSWEHSRLIGCILRAGYILGQRAERARKKQA